MARGSKDLEEGDCQLLEMLSKQTTRQGDSRSRFVVGVDCLSWGDRSLQVTEAWDPKNWRYGKALVMRMVQPCAMLEGGRCTATRWRSN